MGKPWVMPEGLAVEIGQRQMRLDTALALLREAERGRTEVNGVCQWCAKDPYIVAGQTRIHASDCRLVTLLEEN